VKRWWRRRARPGRGPRLSCSTPLASPTRCVDLIQSSCLEIHDTISAHLFNKRRPLQPFSRKSHTATVATEFQIGLYDPAHADLEHFWNCCSAGFLGERLYISSRSPQKRLEKRGRWPLEAPKCALLGVSGGGEWTDRLSRGASASGLSRSTLSLPIFQTLARTPEPNPNHSLMPRYQALS